MGNAFSSNVSQQVAPAGAQTVARLQQREAELQRKEQQLKEQQLQPRPSQPIDAWEEAERKCKSRQVCVRQLAHANMHYA